MKRMHIHLFVDSISESTEFYNQLFSAQPDLAKEDYVRWQLQDPPMNFAISNHGKPGIDHLGIQLSDSSQLDGMLQHIEGADSAEETSCCYARSSKSWLNDPQGIAWEIYQTHHDEEKFFGQQVDSNCCESTSGCTP